MPLLLALTEAAERTLAGGKASSLARLIAWGFPVPSGLVVPSTHFMHHLSRASQDGDFRKLLNSVNYSDVSSINAASVQLRRKFLSVTPDADLLTELAQAPALLGSALLAVRSSAVAEDSAEAAWAGQLETYLGTLPGDVGARVLDCWCSAFSPRALLYAHRVGQNVAENAVAVLLQPTLSATSSGVAFTRNPQRPEAPELLVEASFGLGVSVVDGLVEPDRFVVDKGTGVALSSERGAKEVEIALKNDGGIETVRRAPSSDLALSPAQLTELYQAAIGIEAKYQHACDIEWCFVNDKLTILQARPLNLTSATGFVRLPRLHAKDYQVVFQIRGISLLFSDMLMRTYGRYGAIQLSNGGEFEELISLRDLADRHAEGCAVLASTEDFAAYLKSLAKAFACEEELFGAAAAGDVTAFFRLAQAIFDTYSRMDSMFVDGAVQAQAENTVIAEHLQRIHDSKNVYRASLNRMLLEPSNALEILLATLAQSNSWSPDDLQWLTVKELSLLGDVGIDPTSISSRRRAYVQIPSGGDVVTLSGEDALALISDLHATTEQDNELTGIVMFPAVGNRLTAPVKVFRVDYSDLAALNAEMETMESGHILVAQTTAPELMVACVKASAIVTELGSLTSHATIVSKELKIPCIIGVRNATRLLQDGEVVTLDTLRGTISRAANNTG